MTAAGYAAMVADAVAAMAAARRRAAQGRAVPARRGPPARAAAPCRPSCAGCGPASPTAPSSPCRSPTALSSAPARSSWWPGTGPRCRATPWPAPCPRGDTGPDRCRRPARPGRLGQEPGRTPLRRRRHRRRPGAFCAELSVPPSPPWWPSARWPTWAPGSRVVCRAEPVGVLDSWSGSTPRRPSAARPGPSLAFIDAHEAGERGYWAGPVGWVGAAGDGEWMIGLRSARLDPERRPSRCRPAPASWPTRTPRPRRPRPTSSWRRCSMPWCPAPQCSCGERAGAGGTGRPASATARQARGMLTTMLAPPCGEAATSAVPPSASAMARTMASPSPVPDTERDVSPW